MNYYYFCNVLFIYILNYMYVVIIKHGLHNQQYSAYLSFLSCVYVFVSVVSYHRAENRAQIYPMHGQKVQQVRMYVCTYSILSTYLQ